MASRGPGRGRGDRGGFPGRGGASSGYQGRGGGDGGRGGHGGGRGGPSQVYTLVAPISSNRVNALTVFLPPEGLVAAFLPQAPMQQRLRMPFKRTNLTASQTSVTFPCS